MKLQKEIAAAAVVGCAGIGILALWWRPSITRELPVPSVERPSAPPAPTPEARVTVPEPVQLKPNLPPAVRDAPPPEVPGPPPVMTTTPGRDNPELISFEHGAFVYLRTLSVMALNGGEGGGQRALRNIRRSTGVDAPTADRVLAYMRDEMQSVETFSKQLVVDRCARRSELYRIPLIAVRLESDANAVEAKRDSLVRGLASIVGDDGMNHLRRYVRSDVKKGMVIMSGDAEAVLLELQLTPEQIMAKLCGS